MVANRDSSDGLRESITSSDAPESARLDSGVGLDDEVLSGLDRAKLAKLAKLLFVLNGHKPGPVEGYYVVVCTKPNEEWSIGQLCADSKRPLKIVEDKRYGSAEDARRAAERMRGQPVPSAYEAENLPGACHESGVGRVVPSNEVGSGSQVRRPPIDANLSSRRQSG